MLDVNPQYAHVKLPSGNESTVSIRDLAPCDNSNNSAAFDESDKSAVFHDAGSNVEDLTSFHATSSSQNTLTTEVTAEPVSDLPSCPREESISSPSCMREETVLRRSERVRKPPSRLIQEI